MTFSRPPYALRADLRARLKEEFHKGMANPPFEIPEGLLRAKIAVMKKYDSKWLSDLGILTEAMMNMHTYSNTSPNLLTTKAAAALRLALDYFVRADDVIPDTINEYGYVDDFHFLHLCLSCVAEESPETLEIFFRLHKGSVIDVQA